MLFYPDTLSDFKLLLPCGGALMSLDLGDHSIGLALSDRSRTIGFPLTQITVQKSLMKHLLPFIEAHNVVGLVVGYPLNLNDQVGCFAQKVVDQARDIAYHFKLPTLLYDERFSTHIVEKLMRLNNVRHTKRKHQKDKLAATYFLQTVLDCLKYSQPLQCIG